MRYNKDFYRNEIKPWKLRKKNKTTDSIGEQGNLFNIDLPMSQYILQTALQLSTGVCEDEQKAIKAKSDKRREKNSS